jgi:hypothetical protein
MTKLSELTAAGTLTGTEIVPVVQSVAGTPTTVRTTAAAIAALAPAATPSVYNPSPAMHNLLGWTIDPALVSGLIGPNAGQVTLIKMAWPKTATITNILMDIATAGVGLVGCFAGIYDSTGALLGTTADQSTAWTTTGVKTMALTSPASVPGGANTYIYVALLVGTGSTTFANMYRRVASSTAAVLNLGLTAATARSATSGTGQTTLPSSITMASNTLGTSMIPIAVS